MSDTRLMQADPERVRQRQSSERDGISHASPAEHPVQRLQRQLGNAQVARMLAQREAEGPENEDEELMAKHDVALAQREAEGPENEDEELMAKHDPALQREAEEDELAMKHDPALQREAEEDELQTKHDPSLQREAEEDELAMKHDPALQRESEGGEMEEEELQTKRDPALAQRAAAAEEAPRIGLEGGPVDADLEQRINSQRGGGSGLSDGIRRNMEGAFGTSFEDVRVHTGGEADSLNRSMTAKAFTTGSDIFLRNDTSPTDSNLMAHELTHVVQQRSGGGGGGGMHVGPAGDDSEHEADNMAASIASGSPQRLADEIGHGH